MAAQKSRKSSIVSTPRSGASPKVTSVSATALLGEAPFWLQRMNALLYVDILGFELRRLRYTDKQGETIVKLGHQGLSAVTHPFYDSKDKGVSFVIPVQGSEDQFVAGRGNNIVLLTWDGASQIPASDELVKVSKERNNFVVRGKVDHRGRLWTGTSPSLNPEETTDSKTGSLFCLSSGRKLQRHLEGLYGCNGLEWSLDGKTLFFVESNTTTVDAFDFDIEKGKLSNRRVIFDFEGEVRGQPRGITIDEEGKLWVASFGSSQVARVDPETGDLMKLLPIPCKDVTNVAFGGDGFVDLYVTTCASRLHRGELNAYPGAGTTFRVTDLGVKGFPAREFAL